MQVVLKSLPISPQLPRWTQVVVFQFCELSHTVYAVLTSQIVPTVRKTQKRNVSVFQVLKQENYLVTEFKPRKQSWRKIKHTVATRAVTELKKPKMFIFEL